MVTTDLQQMLSRGQIAHELGVSGEMVTRWLREGRLPSVQTALGKLVRAEDVERLKRERDQHSTPV